MVSEAGKEKHLNLESVTWEDLTWVNIENPTEWETQFLAQNYSFHQLDLDDCLSRIQRPKIDEYQDYLFIVLHFPLFNRETWVTTASQVSIFIGEKYVVTLHQGELKPLAKMFTQCQASEAMRQELFSNGSGYLVYRIIDGLIDSWFPILDTILSKMDDVEDRVFDETVEAAQEVAILRRDVIEQRRIIWPLRAVIGSLESKLAHFTTTDITAYFGDLVDHTDKVWDTLEECKEVIEVFKDADFVLGTERLNRIMRVLTIIATIILPFMAISSLYGMNVHMPGGITSGSWMTFIVIMLAVTLITACMLYFFRRRHWI